jgi:anti-sigma-K factor RskA
MSDIHALVGAYAVDALDDVERAAFERHLAECAACRAEVDGLREASSVIGSSVAQQPPSTLRDRVLADIATVRPLPPLTTPARQRAARFRPALVAAAAAVVIAAAGGLVVAEPWADDTSQVQPTAADRIRAAADAEEFDLSLDGGAAATVIRSKSLNQAVLVTEDMPAAPDGKVYELWLDHEEVGMVAAGLMEDGDDEVVLTGDPATAIGFGITVEPDGGSEEPTESALVTAVDFENA